MSTIALSHLPVPSGWRNAGAFYGPALERIHLGLGYEYDPAVVDALTRVTERSARSPRLG